MIIAAEKGNVEIVHELLKRNVQVNVQDEVCLQANKQKEISKPQVMNNRLLMIILSGTRVVVYNSLNKVSNLLH